MSQLRWAILAAVGGAQLGSVSCAGRSLSREPDGSGGAGALGGAGGSKGGRGGSAAGNGARAGIGGDAIDEGGGRGAAGGRAGSDGAGGAGRGGEGAGRAFPCTMPRQGDVGQIACGTGFVHRPEPSACPSPQSSGEGGAGGEAGGGARACNDGESCAVGERCVHTTGSEPEDPPECRRVCTTDADCGSDELCACTTIFSSAEGAVTGTCLPATCRSDDDCGPGLLCIAALATEDCLPKPHEFHCQTPADECAGGGDCIEQEIGDDCRYDGSRHVCRYAEVCGRPFLVEDEVRLAAPVEEVGWALECGAGASELSEDVRGALARHFTDVALMEHASVAAFARFTLELLALGAPASLVEASSSAMADEVRHARLCFGLAQRYAGAPVGPGPLAVDGALAGVDLLRTVELAVLEGCIGEATAGLEAAWAADAATDATVRGVLCGIAEDETRHAALAFQLVAWASFRDARVPALVARLVQDALEADAARPPEQVAASAHAELLAAHGVLDASSRRAARSAALEELARILLPDAHSTHWMATVPVSVHGNQQDCPSTNSSV